MTLFPLFALRGRLVLYHYKHVVCSACRENEDILQLVIGPVYVDVISAAQHL